jgi:hypothetical protein
MQPMKVPRAPHPQVFVHVASATIHPVWEQYLAIAA